jgi:hypothetical protein
VILRRFRPNGTIDETFGENGSTVVVDGWNVYGPLWMDVTPDGRPMVMFDRSNAQTGASTWFVLRFTADGRADKTFGRLLGFGGLSGVNVTPFVGSDIRRDDYFSVLGQSLAGHPLLRLRESSSSSDRAPAVA